MTSKEFVVWMQGFVTACNEYSPTPKQWDIMKDELAEVKDEPNIGKFDYTYKFPQQQPNVESNQLELEFETK
jgi:hypothetical protein